MQLINHAMATFQQRLPNKFLLLQLIKRDFQARYIGSTFGAVWAFVQPLAMMLILWTVFEYGLKAQRISGNVPFVVWFFVAMIAWNFFAEVLGANTAVISEYSYLLKRAEINPVILPLIKIISSAIIHGIFILIMMGILMSHGYLPNFYWFGVLYYWLATIVLLTGLGWFTSAIFPFWRDIGQIVQIFIQFGFWATPIIWSTDMLPENLQWFLKTNPLLFIIEGYRDVLIYEKPFWQTGPLQTLYFWSLAIGFCLAGWQAFKRLRPHFADVL